METAHETLSSETLASDIVAHNLASGRDGDLLARDYLHQGLTRGRGAQTNVSGRYETQYREVFDDGWNALEDIVPARTHVHEERSKSILTRNSSPDIPFDRSINPYRGCEHGCSYCFARPTHTYLGHSAGLDFETEIYAKVNAATQLRKELAKPRYVAKPIAIGTNTDPYQPIERTQRLMRETLEVLAETKHPVTIVTKSFLVTRDIDILAEMAKERLVRVALSITTLDAKLSRLMEPRASTPAKRLEALAQLSEAGIPTMVLAAPMIPAINDMELERILDASVAQGVSSAGMIMLRLPGEVREIFREWLLRHYPDKVRHVMGLVRDMRGGRDNDPRFGTRMTGQGPYAHALQRRFEIATKRYGLATRGKTLRSDLFVPPIEQSAQLSLF